MGARDTGFRDLRAHKTDIQAITDRIVGLKKTIITLLSTAEKLTGSPEYGAPLSAPKKYTRVQGGTGVIPDHRVIPKKELQLRP